MRSFFEKTLAALILVSLTLSFFAVPLKQVEAIPVEDVLNTWYHKINTWKQTVSTALDVAQTAEQKALVVKFYVLDPIFFYAAKAVIRSITASTVQWINSGFKGNPQFVTDPAKFLRDTADQEIGRFLEKDPYLSFLCSPFQANIRIALQLKYATYQPRQACTLTQVGKNFDRFINGLSGSGNWNSWFQVTTIPTNNPYGAFFGAEAQLQANIANIELINLKKLDWGSGFFSKDDCSTYYDPGSDNEEEICKTRSPGKVIEQQLSHTLGSPLRQYELANSFNQIINALMNQLALQVFSRSGLLGASQSQGGQASLVDQLRTAQDTQGLDLIQSTMNDRARRDAVAEQGYMKAKQDSLRYTIDTGNVVGDLYYCYTGKATSTALSTNDRNLAISRANAASSTINQTIVPKLRTLFSDIFQSSSTLARLNQTTNATSSGTIDDYYSQATGGTLNGQSGGHSEGDKADAEFEREELKTEMGTIKTDAQTKLAACRVFPSPAGSGTSN